MKTISLQAKIICLSVVLIILAFYGGNLYGKKSASAQISARAGGAFGAGRTGGAAGFGGVNRTGGGARGAGLGGGILSGNIISVDANSLTVALRDGGSKIVFLSGSTTIMKSTPGTSADLVASSSVMITGSANPDGSVTAQSVQIRPQRTQ